MSLDEQAKRLEIARSKSVYIATPIARHPVRQYTMSLGRTMVHLQALGIRAWIQNVVGSSNLPRARNELVAGFMASDYTDFLTIDDDMGWEPNDIVRLLASDKDIVAGVGVKKCRAPDTDPAKWCMRTLDHMHQDEMGAIEVEAVGTGFMKISRAVFQRLAQFHPEWKRRGWPKLSEAQRAWYYQFFRFNHERDDEPGEDIEFCQHWRDVGGSVWIDPTIRLTHVGEWEYSGDIEALLESSQEQRCES